MIKKRSTFVLKVALCGIAAAGLALGIFALPSLWKGGSAEFPYASTMLLLIVLGLYATAIPFFIALWQAWKLLRYIDKNQAFSDLSVKALRIIKYCASIVSVLYVAGVPLLFPIAEIDDAPGLILIGSAIACAPIIVAVFAAVLERLLQSVLEIKSENDLTV